MAVISVVFGAAVSDVPWDSFKHWFAFAGFTLFLFSQFVVKSRWAWHNRSFWVWSSIFFAAHCFIFTKLTLSGKEFPAFVWVPIVIGEMAILMLFRRLMYRRSS
jgi:hypothetical protein